MKNKTNGTAPRASKTTTTKPAKTLRELRLIETFRRIDAEDPKRRAKEKEAIARRYRAKKTLTVTVSADIYGFLYAAAVIHDATPEIIASAFLEQQITEWANADFMLED